MATQGEIIKAWYTVTAVEAAVAVIEQETVDGEQVDSRVEYIVSLPLTDDIRASVAGLSVPEQRAIVEPIMLEEFARMYAASHPVVTELEGVTGIVEI